MKHSMSRLQPPFDVTTFIGELCNRETDAVSVTCKKQSLSYCPVDYVPFQNQCFGFKTEIPLDFRAAQNDCKKNGGKLIEIDNQKKNDFISHYLLTYYPLNNFWTGGISTSLDNIQIGKDTKRKLRKTEFIYICGSKNGSSSSADKHR